MSTEDRLLEPVNPISTSTILEGDVEWFAETGKRLTKQYVAESEFGKYINETLNELQATADSFTETIIDSQIIEQEGEEQGTHTYGKVKVGVVGEDAAGNRLIGVEIGQTTVVVDGDTKTERYGAALFLRNSKRRRSRLQGCNYYAYDT